jgi:hypothetical protein
VANARRPRPGCRKGALGEGGSGPTRADARASRRPLPGTWENKPRELDVFRTSNSPPREKGFGMPARRPMAGRREANGGRTRPSAGDQPRRRARTKMKNRTGPVSPIESSPGFAWDR